MNGTHFFDIPVYRLTSDSYYAAQDKYVANQMLSSFPNLKEYKSFYERNPYQRLFREDYLRTLYGGSWKFNEIVGWIELYFLGNQIRGELWTVDVKRIKKSRKKLFKWKTHKVAPETGIALNANNQEIFNSILDHLTRCRKALKNRFLDTSKLELLGPYIDWWSLRRDNVLY